MKRLTDSECKKIAEDLVYGDVPPKEIMIRAGLKPSSVKVNGIKTLLKRNETIRTYVKEILEGVKDLPTPSERANIVRLELLRNVADGEDRAVRSLELLGKDKEVKLFDPDVILGVAIPMPPPEWRGKYLMEDKSNEETIIDAAPSSVQPVSTDQ